MAIVVYGGQLKTCYIDEAGSGEPLFTHSPANTTPVFAIAGLILDNAQLATISSEFNGLKRRFYPHLNAHHQHHHWVLREVKGASLRKQFRETSRNARRAAGGFLDQTLKILENHDVKIVGRIWIKVLGQDCKEKEMYTFSVQNIHQHFEHLLSTTSEHGMAICDSRNGDKNSYVSHSIYTKKNRHSGDPYPHIMESPTFGHSINHVGLQMADVIVSGLFYPIASKIYSESIVPSSIHIHPAYEDMRDQFGQRLKDLQYRYRIPFNSKSQGGVILSDPTHERSGVHLFQSPGRSLNFNPNI